MLIKVLRKMLNTQLINHVHRVPAVAQQKDPNPLNVITVLEEEKLELTRVFSRFSKLVLNAVVTEKQLVSHAILVVVTAKFKQMKM